MKRIAIFIDNSNIFKGFRKYNVKIDYEKLKKLITKKRQLYGIYLYEGIVYPLDPNKKKWYKDLSTISGYEIRASFDKKTYNDTFEKKIDVQIAIDIISLAYEDAFDIAVLVSGDGDFLPVVQKLREINKSTELWAFRYSLANTLKEEIDDSDIYYLDNYLNELRI